MINQSAADWFHIDIMDGVFVPNISFGFPVLKAIAAHARKPLDVHLMIVQPERYLEAFKAAGAHVLSVHLEACTHLHRTVQEIRAAGMQPGVAINPHTSVDLLDDIIADIDLVCVMSVNPGFGGQKFIPAALDKLRAVRRRIDAQGAEQAQGLAWKAGLKQPGHMLAQVGIGMAIAEKPGFRNHHQLHQILLLFGGLQQQIVVGRQLGDACGLEALLHSPHQARYADDGGADAAVGGEPGGDGGDVPGGISGQGQAGREWG